jgi:hypothetical protein
MAQWSATNLEVFIVRTFRIFRIKVSCDVPVLARFAVVSRTLVTYALHPDNPINHQHLEHAPCGRSINAYEVAGLSCRKEKGRLPVLLLEA